MNKDQVKGKTKEVKGTIKESTGKAVGDKDMENEGSVEKSTGKVQGSYGNLKKDINKNT